MNLIEQFNQLPLPPPNIPTVFNANGISGFAFAKIGVNCEGFPALLIRLESNETTPSQRNIRLKNLELTHNVECKISESENVNTQHCTIILLRSSQVDLVCYFLKLSEDFIRLLSQKPTEEAAFLIIRSFVEIFRALSKPATKTIQGLWAELLVIRESKRPEVLLDYWHSNPEEKFDFNSSLERIEVKSTSRFERVHTFTANQLSPPEGTIVLVVSIFMKQSSVGLNILELAQAISQRITNERLIEKMYTMISQTLGTEASNSMEVRFDYELSKKSLKLYHHYDIQKIEHTQIPTAVSDVRFRSDLSKCPSIETSSLNDMGILFSAL